MRTPGATPKVMYDSDSLHFDASSVGFVPWHYLKGVKNKSIKKTAKYKSEVKANEIPHAFFREDLEQLSEQYSAKYLLAVMNSASAKDWLSRARRSKLHIYPDDWKGLPIPAATNDEQNALAGLVDKCITAKGVGCEEWEAEINERVAALYGL